MSNINKEMYGKKAAAAITVTVKQLMAEILEWCQECLSNYPVGVTTSHINKNDIKTASLTTQ